jgi:hypothetical protein
MKSHRQSRGSGGGGRRAVTGALQCMSDRQTQAYLMARDAIRRIQRTSSIVDLILNDAAQRLRAASRSQNSH